MSGSVEYTLGALWFPVAGSGSEGKDRLQGGSGLGLVGNAAGSGTAETAWVQTASVSLSLSLGLAVRGGPPCCFHILLAVLGGTGSSGCRA